MLIFISPFLILYYAEEHFFVDKYKQNEDAFESVKNELLDTLEEENVDELKLVVDYDSNGKRILYDYQDKLDTLQIDANAEDFDIVDDAFGDFYWSKAYISKNYIKLSEEGNNYQYVYCENHSPETMIYGSSDKKIHELGDGWYLIVPE